MTLLNKMKTYEEAIEKILTTNPKARDDDFILYAELIRSNYPTLKDMPVSVFLTNHNKLGCPPFASVTRARRKVQERFPNLASERMKKRRAKLEKEYEEYSRT